MAKFLITMSMTLSLLISVQSTMPMMRCMAALTKRAVAEKSALRFSSTSGRKAIDEYADRLRLTTGGRWDAVTVWDSVQKGDSRAVRWFLKAGVDPNAQRIVRPDDVMNPYRWRNQSKTLLGQALRRGYIWVTGQNGWYITPGDGASDDHRSIIRLLLMRGANPSLRDRGLKKEDSTPLALTNDGEAVTRLLESGAQVDPTLIDDHHQYEILLRQSDLNARDADGDTLLHRLARRGSLLCAGLAYKHGADPLAKNSTGKTPHDLALKDQRAYFRLMELGEIKRTIPPYQAMQGAFNEALQEIEDDPVGFVAKDSHFTLCNAHGTSLFHWAVRVQDRDMVQRFLYQGMPVNQPDGFGLTALHWAIYGEDVDIVELLLREGADPEAKDSFETTPLDIAMRCGESEVMKLLYQYQKGK